MASITIVRSLYKYFPPERIDIFLHGLIRFTPPKEFNDPFDCNPAVLPQEPRALEHLKKIEKINSRYGVLSMSRHRKNIALWSHYGKGHSGFVVKFDLGHKYFTSHREGGLIGRPLPVIYKDKRPHISESQFTWLRTKSTDWKYEREWRMIMPLQEAEVVVSGMHLFRLPKDSIEKVFLGCRMTRGTRDEFRRTISRFNSDIEIEGLRRSNSRYKLV